MLRRSGWQGWFKVGALLDLGTFVVLFLWTTSAILEFGLEGNSGRGMVLQEA